MGILLLAILIGIEIFFLVWNLVSKQSHRKIKAIVNIAEFGIVVVLLLVNVLVWSFRYIAILLMLAINCVIGLVTVSTNKKVEFKSSKVVRICVGKSLLYVVVLLVAIIFPQYKIKPTGEYKVAMKKYVWTDENRKETFSSDNIDRSVTVDVYYPKNGPGCLPLVIFSHGAFGLSTTNESTFKELASNGYIVASINHPYHSLFDLTSYHKLVTVNKEYMNEIYSMNEEQSDTKEVETEHSWINIRVGDINFVKNKISKMCTSGDEIFARVDMRHIGVMGHSLGGAAAVQAGRENDDISAVIDIDGTMLGETLLYADGHTELNTVPYDQPLLDIFARDHYDSAEKVKDIYPNFVIAENSDRVKNIVINDAGHLNFTDLPFFSPILAKKCGIGTVDKTYCLNTTNKLILEFFNLNLKGKSDYIFKSEY